MSSDFLSHSPDDVNYTMNNMILFRLSYSAYKKYCDRRSQGRRGPQLLDGGDALNVLYSPLGMTKTLRMCSSKCGGDEEAGKGGRSPRIYEADGRRTRAVGWATSINKTHATFVQCTYMGGLLLGSSRGPTESGQGFQAIQRL
jgi:hypothetical protein